MQSVVEVPINVATSDVDSVSRNIANTINLPYTIFALINFRFFALTFSNQDNYKLTFLFAISIRVFI